MDWTLPQNLSARGAAIDETYYIILVMTGIAFVLVEAGILWFMFRYRNREAEYTHGNNTAEIIWTAIPAVAMVWLGIHSGGIWADIKGSSGEPEDAFELGVTASQFEWMITYPGEDGELATADDFTLRNDLRFPVGEDVIVRLHSEDVIHSFFLPYLRVKQDVVPGMTTRAWFRATESAELQLACAELCGLGHYRMHASARAMPPDEFRTWYEERAAEAAASGEGGDWTETPPNTPARIPGMSGFEGRSVGPGAGQGGDAGAADPGEDHGDHGPEGG